MNPATEGDEVTRLKRQGADQAIQLALEGKWEEAVTLNRTIVQAAPTDVDAWNRLGKSLLELGRFREAYEAYGRSVEIDSVNQIARRNLERLEGLQDQEAPRPSSTGRVAQDLFIEEVGKTGVTVLQNASVELVPTLTAGDEVFLKPGDDDLRIETADGELLGSIEPKLGLRLLRLIEGGSQYAAAVKSVNDNDVELIVKETYRSPTQTRPSFPSSGGESVRPYIRESLLRLAEDDEDEIDDELEPEEVEHDSDVSETTVSFSTFGDPEVDEDDEDA